MFNTKKFTICLHCGCSADVVNKQIDALIPLTKEYDIHWNNRITRHPEIYNSYSELINHSMATCDTEWMILINDRSHPKPEEIKKMLNLLESGFACVMFWNVAYMGMSKELIRKIGWWDQKFIHGGWEDVDWIFRLRLANLALYESCESIYDQSWKSPLNFPWGGYRDVYWKEKYEYREDAIYKLIKEEDYPHWQDTLGLERPDISSTWKTWDHSILGLEYGNKGIPASSRLDNKEIRINYDIK